MAPPPESSEAGPRPLSEPMACPSCGERSSEGLQFCPHDGARLMPAGSLAAANSDAVRKAPPSLIGKVLADRYRIMRKIGEGGMGEVYEARHVYIDKRFAIKTLRPEITGNAEAVTRFQQEAHAASTIGHENIITIEDFGQLPEGGVYMAMEYLEGSSLAERMRVGARMPRAESIDYVVQVCRGLAAAHEKGIIHRDMKPENVFLVRRGGRTVAKILDFGIAKVQHAGGATQPQLTQTGAVFGTPFYMSPEQALGRALDGRTDVYSVGVILYELFAGRVPFQGDSFMAILSQHITSAPTPPSELAPDRNIPPSFERIILRAMAKEREQRFPSMNALAEALLDAQRHAAAETLDPLPPDSAAPVELAELPPNWLPGAGTVAGGDAARGRGRGGWLAAVGALVAIAIAIATVLAVRPSGRHAGAPVGGGAQPVMTPAPGSPAVPVEAPSVEIVLDSIPSGAKVLAGGRVIAETPEAIRVPVGHTLEVLLHKDGYAARQLSLDPARDGHKVMVTLEREHHGGHPGSPHAASRGAGESAAPAAPPARAVGTPQKAPPAASDPYSPLPAPTRAPVRPRTGAPLDPYGN